MKYRLYRIGNNLSDGLPNQKYRVYVTGSNAKMLSKDIATTLGGRFMIQYVYPFSFREYLSSNGVQLDKLWIYKNRSELVLTFRYLLSVLVFTLNC